MSEKKTGLTLFEKKPSPSPSSRQERSTTATIKASCFGILALGTTFACIVIPKFFSLLKETERTMALGLPSKDSTVCDYNTCWLPGLAKYDKASTNNFLYIAYIVSAIVLEVIFIICSFHFVTVLNSFATKNFSDIESEDAPKDPDTICSTCCPITIILAGIPVLITSFARFNAAKKIVADPLPSTIPNACDYETCWLPKTLEYEDALSDKAFYEILIISTIVLQAIFLLYYCYRGIEYIGREKAERILDGEDAKAANFVPLEDVKTDQHRITFR